MEEAGLRDRFHAAPPANPRPCSRWERANALAGRRLNLLKACLWSELLAARQAPPGAGGLSLDRYAETLQAAPPGAEAGAVSRYTTMSANPGEGGWDTGFCPGTGSSW